MDVVCAPGVQSSARQVQQSALFRSWSGRFQRTRVGRVTVYATYAWDGEIRMIQMGVQHGGFENAVFLRGPTVDMLTVVTDGKTRQVVHVEQPRVAVGQVVRSNPAGMVDTGESPVTAAMRELAEEVGSHIRWSPAQSMHPVVLGTAAPLLVSPGGTDEEVTFYFVEGHLPTDQLAKLSRHIGGLAHEGERLRLRLTPMARDIRPVLTRLCSRTQRPDGKAVQSLLMYAQYLALSR